MLRNIVAFWHLSRPIFLVGGIILYALGAGIAHAQNCSIRPTTYVLGQLVVTCLQLMAQYLNEYWDIQADRLNETRTTFSGGSGILATGLLPRQTALTAAAICWAASVAAAFVLWLLEGLSLLTCGLMLGMFVGAYSYSSPPLSLASSGVGELTASLVVACLVPAFGLVLSGGQLGPTFALAVMPLLVLHYAMLLAFEFPDERSDRIAGKRTLLVRIGCSRGALLHNTCLWAAIILGLCLPVPRLSAWTALGTFIVMPLAIWQTINVAIMTRGRPVRFGRITFVAVIIFSLTTVSLASGFFIVPIVGQL